MIHNQNRPPHKARLRWGLAAAFVAATGMGLALFSAARADTQQHPRPVASRLVPAPEAETAIPSRARPALWVVQDKDTTIYLFGTIHMLKPGISWLNGPVHRALAQSGELVTEIDDPSGLAVRQAVLSRAMLPEGENLRELLDQPTRTALKGLLKRIGLPETALDRYKPWYAAVVLSSLPLAKSGLNPASGAEGVLENAVRKRKAKLGALETPEYQLGLFDGLPRDAQNGFLASVIRDFDKIVPQIDTLVSAWARGDAAGLAAVMNEDVNEDPRLKATLLTNRNRNWAQWVNKRLSRPGTVFVAVGAGHLAGEGSLQDQLMAQGLHARRIQ